MTGLMAVYSTDVNTKGILVIMLDTGLMTQTHIDTMTTWGSLQRILRQQRKENVSSSITTKYVIAFGNQ